LLKARHMMRGACDNLGYGGRNDTLELRSATFLGRALPLDDHALIHLRKVGGVEFLVLAELQE
jgi:hypothetical protein